MDMPKVTVPDALSKVKNLDVIASGVALLSTFLPWVSVSLGELGSVSTNGWNSYGYMTALASIGMILIYALPKLKVKFVVPNEPMVKKVLSVLILVGPLLWLFDMRFAFEWVGFGVYVAILAGAACVYATMKKQ